MINNEYRPSQGITACGLHHEAQIWNMLLGYAGLREDALLVLSLIIATTYSLSHLLLLANKSICGY